MHECPVNRSCLPLCGSLDCSPPGFSVHGVFPGRILGWAAMPSFRGSSQLRDGTCRFFTTELPGTPRYCLGTCYYPVQFLSSTLRGIPHVIMNYVLIQTLVSSLGGSVTMGKLFYISCLDFFACKMGLTLVLTL